MENNYGIPPGAHSHEDEQEIADETEKDSVRIDLKQTRYDMKAEIKQPFEFAKSVNVKLRYNDYQHTEIENKVAGTLYSNEGVESRIELIHKPWAFFDHGVLGMQTKNNEFSAIGEESLVPISDITSFGFFTVQDIHTEKVTYEMGARVEQQWIDPENRQQSSHTPFSFSASALWSVTPQDSLKLSFTRSERAPDIQELFIYGAHLSTGSFEIGNADLDEEASHNIELGLHIDRDWVQAEINLYQNWVNDYIAMINTGQFFNSGSESIVNSCSAGNCLPVFHAQQRDAEFQGFEAQITFPLVETSFGRLNSEFFADYVRGRYSSGGDIPRMPPLRYGMQLAWDNPDWSAKIRMTRAERQNHSGDNETETNGYWQLNMAANYRLNFSKHADLLFFAKANNLLDDEIRNSVSYLRNLAPEAGRSAEMGLRIEF